MLAIIYILYTVKNRATDRNATNANQEKVADHISTKVEFCLAKKKKKSRILSNSEANDN